MTLNNEAAEQIEALCDALEAILNKVDYENPGAAFEPDSGCLECTSGVTPNRFNTGLCAHHRAIAALSQARGEDQ
jgi:hypothetical protein